MILKNDRKKVSELKRVVLTTCTFADRLVIRFRSVDLIFRPKNALTYAIGTGLLHFSIV